MDVLSLCKCHKWRAFCIITKENKRLEYFSGLPYTINSLENWIHFGRKESLLLACTDGYPRWTQDKKKKEKKKVPTEASFGFCCPLWSYLEGPVLIQGLMAVIWGPMGQGACKIQYLLCSTKQKPLKSYRLSAWEQGSFMKTIRVCPCIFVPK